ncbi:MAG: energy-coupling factor ABC transporter permease [Candidatus Omnitrophica bacterium]|nr:energy-coupling factor ABC transporter permease [Candidatus Omnitrophota bacterium]
MHIPNEMLNGTICPVTAAISAIGIAGAAFAAVKSKEKPEAGRFAAVTAFLFAAQMMNFQVQQGTSGHLLGGVLASALLGAPFGILAMALILTIQSIVFSDGGLHVLGANVLNMALIGAGFGAVLRSGVLKKSASSKITEVLSAGLAAWFSVLTAAAACVAEIALTGAIPFQQVVRSMVGVHAVIGIGECLLTALAFYFLTERPALNTSTSWNISAPVLAAVLMGGLLSPFASRSPDGLEWIALKYNLLHNSAPAFVSLLPDYTVPVISSEIISTSAAGLTGVLLAFALAWGMMRGLSFFNRIESSY